MGGRPVHLAPSARQEFLDAADYYEDKRAGLGDDFIACVRDTLQRIGEAPDAHALLPGFEEEGCRRAGVRRFPYHLIFLELPHDLRVIAVAHARRRPAYWRPRLSED